MGGGYSFIACLSLLTIDNASLARRSGGVSYMNQSPGQEEWDWDDGDVLRRSPDGERGDE